MIDCSYPAISYVFIVMQHMWQLKFCNPNQYMGTTDLISVHYNDIFFNFSIIKLEGHQRVSNLDREVGDKNRTTKIDISGPDDDHTF